MVQPSPYIHQSEKLAKYRSKRKHQLNVTILNDFFVISKKVFDFTVVYVVVNHC